MIKIELHNKFEMGSALTDKEIDTLGQAYANLEAALKVLNRTEYRIMRNDVWRSLDKLRVYANARRNGKATKPEHLWMLG